MTTEADKKQQESGLLTAFESFEHFCKVMLDSWALIDTNGKVVKANPLFAQLVGQKPKMILKAESIDNLIKLSLMEKPLLASDLLKYQSPTRIDEVRGTNHQTDSLNLIIGVYPITDAKTQAGLGTFLLIRDVTAETNLQDKYKTTAIKSITDPLTGLFTRGYFEEFLESQIRTLALLHESGEHPELSLIMADIDFFKKVNDKYGHQAGDYVIQSVANIMRKTFRKTDLVCRYGGEEFLVILPSTSLAGASYAAEKLRLAIEAERMVFDGTHIPVTISSGVAQIKFGKETYTETMGRADAALYFSKESGRNKASIHDGESIVIFNLKPFQAA